MLDFPDEYFQPEYREGFLVDATMKTVWAAELELLNDIAIVCKKYNLQYYAYWGTLLGAIRHKGFIPWDDDMDIALKRKDYNTLLRVLPDELPKTYRVYHALSEKGHSQFWACVANADTISIEKERLKKFHNCPFWVGIDIAPLDIYPRNPADATLLHSFMVLLWKAMNIVKQDQKTKKDERDLEDTLAFLEENLHTKFDRSRSLPEQLSRMENLLAMSYGEEDGDAYTMHATAVKRTEDFYFPKEWLEDVVEVPYETITIPVPVGYDKILEAQYGDYHERLRGTADHDYPFYQKQIQQLRDKVKEMEERSV